MPLFNRHNWRKAAQQYLYTNHPHLVPKLTSKVIDSCCAYMRGYEDSLIKNTNPPHNEDDMKQDVRDAGITEAIRLINEK